MSEFESSKRGFENRRDIQPDAEFSSANSFKGKEYLDRTFKYEILNNLHGAESAADEIAGNPAIIDFAENRRKYKLIDFNSEQGKNFVQRFNDKINENVSGLDYSEVGYGTPIMVESEDSEKGKTFNVIFAIAENSDGYQFLSHPILVDESGQVTASPVNRNTESESAPSIWPVQEDHPFGFQGGWMKNINSFPTK